MNKLIPLLLRIIVAIVLTKTLVFKVIAHPDCVFIFSKIGLEPYGRIITGITEGIAGILLLFPKKTVWIGATLTLGVIGSAIMIHLTRLGIEVNNDNGLLFISAIITFVLSAVILWIERKQITFF